MGAFLSVFEDALGCRLLEQLLPHSLELFDVEPVEKDAVLKASRY